MSTVFQILLARIRANVRKKSAFIRVYLRPIFWIYRQCAGGCAAAGAGLLKSTVGGVEIAFSFSTEKFALVL